MRIETIELSMADLEVILAALETHTTVAKDLKLQDLPKIDRLREAITIQYEAVIERQIELAGKIKQFFYLTELNPRY